MLKEISGHTKMMGTVGHPVSHSLSPMIHTALGLRYDRDLVYLAYDITADRVEDFAKAMRTLGILGCNITMPDKEAIIPYLDELDPFAARCVCWCWVPAVPPGPLWSPPWTITQLISVF